MVCVYEKDNYAAIINYRLGGKKVIYLVMLIKVFSHLSHLTINYKVIIISVGHSGPIQQNSGV